MISPDIFVYKMYKISGKFNPIIEVREIMQNQRIAVLILLLIVIGFAPFQKPAQAYEDGFKDGECVVRFVDNGSKNDYTVRLAMHAVELTFSSKWTDWHVVSFNPAEDVHEKCADLAELPYIADAYPNAMATAFSDPNDELYPDQWYLPLIHQDQVWEYTEELSDVIVAVLDQGYYPNHPDMINVREVPGYDVLDDDDDPSEPGDSDCYYYGHGAFMASIILASTNNGQGIASIAPNCRLMHVRVLAPQQGTAVQIAEGIDYAIENGAQVINMSLGFVDVSGNPVDPGPVLAEAIERAGDAGIFMASPTGNRGDGVAYPAAYNDVVAVGGVTYLRERAWYSNTGSEIEVVAPGGDQNADDNNDGKPDAILGAGRNGGTYTYDQCVGTSSSTAMVSGLAALLLANGAQADQVRDLIVNTATDLGEIGWDEETGYGLINVAAALNEITGDGPNVDKPVLKPAVMSQTEPNTFIINFIVPETVQATIRIYNMTGQRVKTVYSGEAYMGSHSVRWRGKNSNGENVASGVYYCHLKAGSEDLIEPIVLVK